MSSFMPWIGFGIDCLLATPIASPIRVEGIGWLIGVLERKAAQGLSRYGCRRAGRRGGPVALVVLTAVLTPCCAAMGLPVHQPLAPAGVESVMMLADPGGGSLRVEAMKVYTALQTQSLEAARKAVSMIVGRTPPGWIRPA